MSDINENKIIFKLLPQSLHHYVILLRLDRPIGYMLLFYPAAFTIALSEPLSHNFFYSILIFLIGAIIMRSAGCIVNDIIDRKIDNKVMRTKDRPLVSGSVSLRKATFILFILLFLGLLILLSLNIESIFLGLIILPLLVLYPMAKKNFLIPQLILGLVYSWGVFISWSATGFKVEYNTILFLYLSCVSWTLIYDTVYATQDEKEDKILKLYSSAILLGEYKKVFLVFFTFIQFSLLNFILISLNLSFYYSLLMSILGIIMVIDLIYVWDFSGKKSLAFFKRNNVYGLIILMIFIVSKNI